MGGYIMAKKHNKPIKPNIGALHGHIGMSIIKTIRKTPRPDFTEMDKQICEYSQKVMAEKANEQY